MSVSEAAKRLGVDSRTVRRWINKGYFPNAYSKGLGPTSPYVIPISDIKAFEKRRRK